MNIGEPSPQGQFYGRLYDHNAHPLENWKEQWTNKHTRGSAITDRISAVHTEQSQRTQALRHLNTGARELAKQDDFQMGLIKCLPSYKDRTRERILGREIGERLAEYFSKLLEDAYRDLGIPFSIMKTISGQLVREIFENAGLLDRLVHIDHPNAGVLLTHINTSAYTKIHARTRL